MRRLSRAAVALLLLVLVLPLPARSKGEKVVRLEVSAAFGSTRTLFVEGRALEGAPPSPANDNDSLWRNVRRLASALESDEVAHMPLVLAVGTAQWRVLTDEEGFFRIALDAPDGSPWRPEAPPRIRVGLDNAGGPFRMEPLFLVPTVVPDGSHVVISDIDDTILDTGVTDRSRMVRRTVTRNAATLEAIPGMSALYRGLREAPASVAVFAYVSGSPANLNNRLHQFLERQRFPAGPMFLKNVGFLKDDSLHEQVRYKTGRLDLLALRLPGTKFLLFGDDGQSDALVYDTFRQTHPGRVVAVFLRRVPDLEEEREVPPGLHRMETAADAARFLFEAGLLSLQSRDRVLRELPDGPEPTPSD